MIRNIQIDRMKGIGMILVVLGHLIVYGQPLSNIIYYFHMPLFFIISGMFLYRKDNVKLSKQLSSIGVKYFFPYVLFHIIMLSCRGPFHMNEPVWWGGGNLSSVL